ncbi:MAG TPA: hypothetical protein VLF62_03605 [Candidatus Saccharimonadales bacterium]|nr:hypothetical protein [Candidatus Saccharimonadales bacterium]
MPRAHPLPRSKAVSPERKFINKIIIPVAIIQPLGTIPQIIAVFGHHDGSSLSISSWLLYLVFDILWLWYGFSEKQKAVIASAITFTIMEGAVLTGALLYGGRW